MGTVVKHNDGFSTQEVYIRQDDDESYTVTLFSNRESGSLDIIQHNGRIPFEVKHVEEL